MSWRIEVKSNVIEVQDDGEIVAVSGNPFFAAGLRMNIPPLYNVELLDSPAVGVVERILQLHPGARVVNGGDAVKGSPFSGYHYPHHGRPGMRGGSLPREAPTIYGSSEAAREIKAVYRAKYAKRRKKLEAEHAATHEQLAKLLERTKGQWPKTPELDAEIHRLSAEQKSLAADFQRDVLDVLRRRLGKYSSLEAGNFKFEIDERNFKLGRGVPLHKEDRAMIEESMRELGAVMHKRNMSWMGVTVHVPDDYEGSAYCKGGVMILIPRGKYTLTPSTVFHEMGHSIEHADHDNFDLAVRFLEERAGDLKDLRSLNEIAGCNDSSSWLPYAKDSKGVDGKFISTYAGRLYHDSSGQISSTEVISVGLAAFMTDPYVFFKRDPEHFGLIVDILMGEADPNAYAY